ncbi:fimbrial protein [Providencia stuartii]|uniref:fimbrial protein n=1 Tax=Providencia stuartii TaxID=588 RepID=UPI002887CEB9|nr:fimbrial protein [Providencia stuartii]MDT1067775.1 fimbrial protein [Providencia stuartii]
MLFKKSLLALSLMTLSAAALSAPIANLKVTGSIAPPTCLINGGNEDTFIYEFDFSRTIFPASGDLVLNAESKNIEVVCDATTILTFTAVDDRSATVLTPGDNNFGLGSTSDSVNIGFYTVTMENATVKENANAKATSVSVLVGSDFGSTGTVSKTETAGWATAPDKLAQGQIFAADFTVTPTINGDLKNSAGDVSLDGYAVLTFAFGL